MSQALYRKYRSKTLDELVGQDHIVRALSASIKSGKISHAYLFTGPRGTGKTSVARILAYDLNGISYDERATYIDIIEIDAASNRRIDEIRDLREKVNIAPTTLKYKVYIIDEVHMLTKEAFNALLKTLEEPPEYVVFILATTELHKVPDTIVSRTQRYAFRPIERSKIVEHLKFIADKENIAYESDALVAIAEHADGGFRDAIGLLDQVRHTSDTVTTDSVMDMLGVPPVHVLADLWVALSTHTGEAPSLLQSLYASGYHAPQISKVLLQNAVASAHIELARSLLGVSASHDPKTELLLIALSDTQPTIPETKPPDQPKVQDTPKVMNAVAAEPKPLPKVSAETMVTDTAEETIAVAVEPNDTWEKILDIIKSGGHSVYGPLRLAEASIEGNILKIGLAFPFHINRVNDKKNLDVVYSAVLKVTGKEHEIIVHRIDRAEPKPQSRVITKPESLPDPTPESMIHDDPDVALMTDPLSIVKNVFGSAEIL